MASHTWRNGDMALCGASEVQIAMLDGARALVVGGGQFGPWSIWMEASALQQADRRAHAASPENGRVEYLPNAGDLAVSAPPANSPARASLACSLV